MPAASGFLCSVPAVLITAGSVGLCIGTYLFFRGFALLKRRRLILDTPFSTIRSASLGMVEITGQAVGPYTITAPLIERPCYYYHTQVWEWKKQGDDKRWVKVVDERVHVPFFIDDNTGRVLVDPRGAELEIHRDFQEEFCDSFFSAKDPVPSHVSRYLARHGVMSENKIKVEEYCIKPKNALFVLGTLAENPGLEVTPQPIHETDNQNAFLGFSLGLSLPMPSTSPISKDPTAPFCDLRRDRAEKPQSAPERLQVVRLTPEGTPTGERTQQQRITAALLKAGITNPAAWEVAGVGQPTVQVSTGLAETKSSSLNRAQLSPRSTESLGVDTRPPVVLMKGTNDQSFMISWRSQQKVARALGWKSALMIWGGPAVALPCLYLLLQVLRLL